MPYCSKCGSEIAEEMRYCPKCGASIETSKISREKHEKQEKEEKHEKEEKFEKHEKFEKQESNHSWMLLGGFILIVFGLFSIISTYISLSSTDRGAIFLVLVGIMIMIIAFYGTTKAVRSSPKP